MYAQTLFSRSVICAAASDTLHLGLSLCSLSDLVNPLFVWLPMRTDSPRRGGGGEKMKCRVWTCVGFAVRDAPFERLPGKKSGEEEGEGGSLNWLEPVSP